MTCRELIELLGGYLDGVLPPEQTERFEAHLAECAACKNYLEAYGEARKLARDAFRSASPPDVPEDLIQAILDSRRSSQ